MRRVFIDVSVQNGEGGGNPANRPHMLVHIAGPGELGAAHTALELLLLGVGGQVPVILGVVSQLPAAVKAAVVAFRRGIHLKARNTL
jgi:hypothetical protein